MTNRQIHATEQAACRATLVEHFGWNRLVAALVMLACVVSHGAELDYFSSRKWIEQQCATNATPPDQQLFVGRMLSPRYANIIKFRKGITIREIVDKTPLKGKVIKVCVMWPHTIPKSGSTFTRHEYIRVRPFDAPDYEVKNLDVIWLYDEGPIIRLMSHSLYSQRR